MAGSPCFNLLWQSNVSLYIKLYIFHTLLWWSWSVVLLTFYKALLHGWGWERGAGVSVGIANPRRADMTLTPFCFSVRLRHREATVCVNLSGAFWDIVWNGIVKKNNVCISTFFINSMIFFYVPYTPCSPVCLFVVWAVFKQAFVYEYAFYVMSAPNLPFLPVLNAGVHSYAEYGAIISLGVDNS